MQEEFPPRHHFERPPYNPHRFEYPQGEFPAGEKPASRTSPVLEAGSRPGFLSYAGAFCLVVVKSRLGSTLEDWTCAA